MTLDDQLRLARQRLIETGMAESEASTSAEVLAREALGWERPRFLAALSDNPPESFEATFARLIRRRATGEPTAYIVGRREFWGLDFEVTPAVLIPRPDTEFIIEETTRILDSGRTTPLMAADVGTGSGCLAWSSRASCQAAASSQPISRSRRSWWHRETRAGTTWPRASPSCRPTCSRASAGRSTSWCPTRPTCRPCSWGACNRRCGATSRFGRSTGGPTAMDILRRLLEEAAHRLRPGGWLVFEFGYGQEQSVLESVAEQRGLAVHSVASDLQGIPRTAVVRRR